MKENLEELTSNRSPEGQLGHTGTVCLMKSYYYKDAQTVISCDIIHALCVTHVTALTTIG